MDFKKKAVGEDKKKGPMLMLSVGPFGKLNKILFTFLL